MSMKLFYFSGTGNSLAVARELKRCLQECDSCLPLASVKSQVIDADAIGLVFPVYFMDTPLVVEKFLRETSFTKNPYIFAVATCNGQSGRTMASVQRILAEKGLSLSSGFVLSMPGNALITDSDVISKRLKEYKAKTVEIAETVNKRSVLLGNQPDSVFINIESVLMKLVGKHLYIMPDNVHSTSDCIGCGICTNVCPLQNIKLINKRPSWGEDCSGCLACFHWCPKNAVHGGILLRKRPQYHHPEINIMDMKR